MLILVNEKDEKKDGEKFDPADNFKGKMAKPFPDDKDGDGKKNESTMRESATSSASLYAVRDYVDALEELVGNLGAVIRYLAKNRIDDARDYQKMAAASLQKLKSNPILVSDTAANIKF